MLFERLDRGAAPRSAAWNLRLPTPGYIGLALFSAGALAVPAIGFAQEKAISARLGLALVGYDSPNVVPASADFESTYRAMMLGASYVFPNGWFGDVGLRRSLSAEWNTQESFPGTVSDDDFSRTETTFTAGKALADGMAVFGGLQIAKSELTFSPTNTIFPGDEDLDLKGKLWFVGASKAVPVSRGALSFSAALSILKVKAEWSGRFQQEASRTNEESGSGAGFSFGAAYRRPFSDFDVLVDIRFQSNRVEYSVSSANEKAAALGLSLIGRF